MTRRLLAVPLVVGGVATGAACLWISGMVWPIATTFYRCFTPSPATAETEADWA